MIRNLNSMLADVGETCSTGWDSGRRQQVPRYLFLLLCLNLVAAPAVYAATDGAFSKTQSYAIALLALTTVALAAYLFVVIFQPERF
ncbi:K(+)-transporting ATPase subunit F [Myxacorys almedinensis]|uniref:K(+)-transporting ATPase subunit F n=1 Tax=Myxacorys almedinensis A TaxID=2690445 RepID=A0A8J7ZBQ0_9CYAN|nr:K(+)-transporting ATPase subunit F [Myxacorys almedinensis]NDJ19020.1 K(+)-transporting ATPase subunit F [Myxacorys almedinensis A]